MFNYNNYIGKHMSEPLQCVFSDGDIQNVIGYNRYKSNDEFYEELIYEDENKTQNWDYAESCKPLIKSPSDLTDAEWLFVFGKTSEKEFVIVRDDDEESVYIKFNDGEKLHYQNVFFLCGHFEYCDQKILNRLYSFHVSLDYYELIKNNKAVRKQNDE